MKKSQTLLFLLLLGSAYSFSQNHPDLSSTEVKNEYVIITGILDQKTDFPNIVSFDPIELKLKAIDFIEHTLSRKKIQSKV